MGKSAAIISTTQVSGRVKMYKNNLQPRALNVQCIAHSLIFTFPQPYPSVFPRPNNNLICAVSLKSLYFRRAFYEAPRTDPRPYTIGGNCEEHFPKKPVGCVSADCPPFVGVYVRFCKESVVRKK